jgi:hypothetical protein
MGNFKHQSIRSSDREKDKDADRDRERDLRDKEGQERLRSVSPWPLSLSLSDPLCSSLINMTATAYRPLLAAPASGPESGIPPLIW